jgi:hypothetical protein
MAITVHWMGKRRNQLELCSALIAFREVTGHHSGDNLGKVLFNIIQNTGIAHKVCLFILCFSVSDPSRLARLHSTMHQTITQ